MFCKEWYKEANKAKPKDTSFQDISFTGQCPVDILFPDISSKIFRWSIINVQGANVL